MEKNYLLEKYFRLMSLSVHSLFIHSIMYMHIYIYIYIYNTINMNQF